MDDKICGVVMKACEEIGWMLKANRVEKGFTQKALAEKVGMSAKRISEIERGKVVPAMEELIVLVDAIGCKLEIAIK